MQHEDYEDDDSYEEARVGMESTLIETEEHYKKLNNECRELLKENVTKNNILHILNTKQNQENYSQSDRIRELENELYDRNKLIPASFFREKSRKKSGEKSGEKSRKRSGEKSRKRSGEKNIQQVVIKPFMLYKSTNKNKKWDVYIPSTRGLKKVSYGAFGMSDYTFHKDKVRRDMYRNRHKNDHISDPYKAGFWSWWHLWGESFNSKTSFKGAVRKAKKLLYFIFP